MPIITRSESTGGGVPLLLLRTAKPSRHARRQVRTLLEAAGWRSAQGFWGWWVERLQPVRSPDASGFWGPRWLRHLHPAGVLTATIAYASGESIRAESLMMEEKEAASGHAHNLPHPNAKKKKKMQSNALISRKGAMFQTRNWSLESPCPNDILTAWA